MPGHGLRRRPQGDIGLLIHREDLEPRLLGNHQGMALDAGVDIEEGKVVTVLPDLVARDLTGNDAFENRRHFHLPVGR
jgi:hypothetical protein